MGGRWGGEMGGRKGGEREEGYYSHESWRIRRRIMEPFHGESLTLLQHRSYPPLGPHSTERSSRKKAWRRCPFPERFSRIFSTTQFFSRIFSFFSSSREHRFPPPAPDPEMRTPPPHPAAPRRTTRRRLVPERVVRWKSCSSVEESCPPRPLPPIPVPVLVIRPRPNPASTPTSRSPTTPHSIVVERNCPSPKELLSGGAAAFVLSVLVRVCQKWLIVSGSREPRGTAAKGTK